MYRTFTTADEMRPTDPSTYTVQPTAPGMQRRIVRGDWRRRLWVCRIRAASYGNVYFANDIQYDEGPVTHASNFFCVRQDSNQLQNGCCEFAPNLAGDAAVQPTLKSASVGDGYSCGLNVNPFGKRRRSRLHALRLWVHEWLSSVKSTMTKHAVHVGRSMHRFISIRCQVLLDTVYAIFWPDTIKLHWQHDCQRRLPGVCAASRRRPA